MNEIEKFLGRKTAKLLTKHKKNLATDTNITAAIEAETAWLIEHGYIDPNGETAQVRRHALNGSYFRQGLDSKNIQGTCMDDVTPFDR